MVCGSHKPVLEKIPPQYFSIHGGSCNGWCQLLTSLVVQSFALLRELSIIWFETEKEEKTIKSYDHLVQRGILKKKKKICDHPVQWWILPMIETILNDGKPSSCHMEDLDPW